ncbi:MAG: hypothetical protein L3J35_10020 [Bacteroidales bacterium]|nr:hypothetical protein [Bacteroidales bacterium]
MENSKKFKNLNELFENYYDKKQGQNNRNGTSVYISQRSKDIVEHISKISDDTMKNVFDIILDDFVGRNRDIIKNA